MFKGIIKSFVFAIIFASNIIQADIDGHRAAIFFNLTDFLSGAVTKDYLETKGTVEYDIHDKMTLGVGASFVNSKNTIYPDSRSIVMYFDYNLIGDKNNHFFIRTGISHKTISLKDAMLKIMPNSGNFITVDNQKDMHVDLAIGRKNYFDNRFCLQYGAGITTDIDGISHFNFNIKNTPISLIAFIKIGYWI